MAELKPCDKEVFTNGHLVMITHTIPSRLIEKWVKKVAKTSGQRVDWHYAGGRACIMAIGDLQTVYDVIDSLMPEHDALQIAAHGELLPGMPYEANCSIYGPYEVNTMHEYIRARHAN